MSTRHANDIIHVGNRYIGRRIGAEQNNLGATHIMQYTYITVSLIIKRYMTVKKIVFAFTTTFRGFQTEHSMLKLR